MKMNEIFTETPTKAVPELALVGGGERPKRVILLIEGEIVGDNKGDEASEEHGREEGGRKEVEEKLKAEEAAGVQEEGGKKRGKR